MADLRRLATELGWDDPATYIQSGNLVFRATETAEDLAAALEKALADRFGFEVPVVVRDATDWLRDAASSPFPDAEHERPNLLHLALARQTPPKGLASDLQRYCTAGERIAVRRGVLWLDYPNGVARSKVTPAVLDRAVGAPVTARNWKTVRALAAMLDPS